MGKPGKLTLPIVRRLVDDIVLVSEGALEQAIVILIDVEKTVAEGAGAAGLAALIESPIASPVSTWDLYLCGGNIDLLMLAEIIERGLVRTGQLTRLTVEIRDLPGALAKVTACIAGAHANIEEVHHQRKFTRLPLESTEVEFVLQTRNRAHGAEVITALHANGFTRLNDASD